MKSNIIRQKFINYFVERGHTRVPSSSLIPAQDPSLLFTNAGMNQFKDLFLGKEKRPYTCATSCQKCVRAGGKHNDLDNVGFTQRHLTFFEMLGNFSFGDYFKKEAIDYAWNFLTKEMKLPVEKLYVSVYTDDDESFDIWHKQIGIPKEKIYRLGEKDNFWQMGDMGPCGPCTEIHIDRGPEYGCKDFDSCGPACDCDRFLEIWNLVFMQFDRQQDGTLKPLEQKSVDTGMGLERLAAIMQNKDSVFDIDSFVAIRTKIEELSGKKYDKQTAEIKAAFHVLEDHIRSSSFLIADGCIPSNEGRGYVLRKIIRRAALFERKLTDKSIFPQLSSVVIDTMADTYPELKEQSKLIHKTIAHEVEKFAVNLERGKALLEKYFAQHQDDHTLSGQEVFTLYDTYGFPVELVQVIAKEHGFAVNLDGFEMEMIKQQERSGKPKQNALDFLQLPNTVKSNFTGYDELETSSVITALVDEENNIAQKIEAGKSCWVIAGASPFFVMGGGQSPDKGTVIIHKQHLDVQDIRLIDNAIAIKITTPVEIKVDDNIICIVDKKHRDAIIRNHTATHLLQSALMELFNKNIRQSGSFVADDYLRFDFTTLETPSHEILNAVERLVNEKIQENIPVCIRHTDMAEAQREGALASFEDKYDPNNVRIVTIPGFSAELCCGTHVKATGDIGAFKIAEIKTISAGNRRIVAVTGQKAIELFQETFDTVKDIANEYKIPREEVMQTVQNQRELLKELQTENRLLNKEILKHRILEWQKEITKINDMPFLYLELQNLEHTDLKEITDLLIKQSPGFYFATSSNNDRSIFVAQLAPQFTNAINLKKFSAWLKDSYGLRGGGSQTIIQGSGEKFDAKFENIIKEWIKNN